MGLFGPSKSLSFLELEEALRGIAGLEPSDKEVIEDAFKKYRSGGISKRDIKLVTSQLIKDTKDDVLKSEGRRVRTALLNFLKSK